MSRVSPQRRRAWFDRGAAAFARSFPGHPHGYVCPLCLRGFTVQSLEVGALTVEHVPPKSVGGAPLVLLCGDCNHGAGSVVDAHMKLHRAVANLSRLPLTEPVDARVEVLGDTYNVRLTGDKNKLTGRITSRNNNRSTLSGLIAHHEQDDIVGSGTRISFFRLNNTLSAVGWLKAGYLATFVALGYRYILDPALDIVRSQIKNPTEELIPAFLRANYDQSYTERRIMLRTGPNDTTCVVVQIGQVGVFLPEDGDMHFYEQLSSEIESTSGPFAVEGAELDWPREPIFALDFENVRT